MSKDMPAAPTPPDPVATANAQAAANTTAAVTQANLNRIDQVTPQGSLTYTQNGVNADGTPKYTQTQTYSPGQEALYDSNNKIAQALNGLAVNNTSRVADTQATPFTFDGVTPQTSSVNSGRLTYGVDTSGVQSTFGTAGPLTSNVANPNVQTGVDYGGAFNPGSFADTQKQAQDAAYSSAAARLDPQYAQQESDFKARLANSGISENSDAYRREVDNFSRAKTDAYGQAQNAAVQQGNAAQQAAYAEALSTRGQNTNETTQAGDFANAAAGQIFGMGSSNAALNNAAQGQQFNQNQAAATFGNAAQGQRVSQASANAALNNTAQGQLFQQGSANAALGNASRQQQEQELAYLRNIPINDIAALLGTGGGVQNPTFNPVSQVGVAAPDYQGAVYQNYNAANQQYTAAQQAQGAGIGSLFGLAGTLGGAYLSGGTSLFGKKG